MHWSRGFALAGQLFVVWLVLSAVASPVIGNWIAKRRTKREFEFLLERERRLRMERLSDISYQDECEVRPFLLDEPGRPRRRA